MEIKVLSVSKPETKTKGKGTWQVITVTYEDSKGKREKTLASFAGDVYKDFAGISEFPCTADVQVVKEGDFWNWKGATFNVFPTASNNETKGSTTTVQKGNWETAEERAARQRYIVRQSSIDYALKFFGLIGTKPTKQDVTDTASFFEAFVFEEDQPVAKKPGRPKKVIDTETPDGDSDDPVQ